MNLEELYTADILALAAEIPRLGRLSEPDATATMRSRLCGSRIIVDARLDGDRIADYAHELAACALAQASASILARNVLGKSAGELFEAREKLSAMLKEGGPPPQGDWSALALFEPVREVPARHDSVLLPFSALCKALAEAGRGKGHGS